MKTFAIFAAVLTTAISSTAETNTLARFFPPLSTNTPIIWQAPTNHVPKSLWIYRRGGPRVFSEAMISNAFVLASLQGRKIPPLSTNDFIIMDKKPANYLGPIFDIFRVSPSNGTINYTRPNPDRGSSTNIPDDATIVVRAWKYAAQLGLDPKLLRQEQMTSQDCDYDDSGREAVDHLCGRGVYLSRLLDGFPFWGNGDGDGGFWIEFGSKGKIRSFTLTWPNLERYESQLTASPQQIVACIRAQKVIVIPNGDEGRYFERVKALANAKTFTIKGIIPSYCEGVFGQTPKNDEPSDYFRPLAELAVVADFGNSNMTVRILTPVLSSDVARLLRAKAK